MPINLDMMRYIVISDHQDGPLSHERMLSDMDRRTTVQDIATGQIENVMHVIEWNAAEKTSRDVTEDIMQEAAESILDKHRYIELNDWQRDFVDSHFGVMTANHFQQVA